MKLLSAFLLFVLYSIFTFGQSKTVKFKKELFGQKELSLPDVKAKLLKHDFSGVFTHTDNSAIYGSIGNNYQRIRIKFITVTRDSLAPDIYHVYGKSMVKKNIDGFKGIIKISNIFKLNTTSYGLDNVYKNKGIKGRYIIVADYKFSEYKDQLHSGVFKGVCESDFYLDKNNKVHYDDIEFNADGYTNNQFAGEWVSYDGKGIQRCNWGDFRIPGSGDLDNGAGDFSPRDKYLKYGWQSMREKDKKIENEKWWK